jgi:hypothetical protein
MSIIMRATLHDHAPNTYYGRWPGKKAAVSGFQSPAIAHDELAASARVVTFDVRERDFPGNRSQPRWKFVSRPKRKICAPGVDARGHEAAGRSAAADEKALVIQCFWRELIATTPRTATATSSSGA